MSAYIRSKPANVSLSQHLEQGGFGDQALEAKKTEAEIGKTEADSGKSQIEHHLKQLEMVGQINQGALYIPGLNKQKMYDYYKNKVDLGILPPESLNNLNQELSSVPDDEQSLKSLIDTHIQGGLKAADSLKYRMPDANAQLGAQTTMRSQYITQQNNQFNQGMSQQEFGLKQSDSNFERKYKVAGLERQKSNDEFSQGIDSKKYQLELDKYNNPSKATKPTEFQGKSALYANRAEEAEQVLSSLDYSPAAIGTKESLANTPLIGGALGAGANMMLSGTNQKAEQAQRNFINAILRQESGAVISPAEFENAKKQYFPAVGDSDAVKAQKAANRRTAIDSIKNNAQGVMDTTVGQHSPTGSWEKPSDWEQFLKERGK